ncbi:MAG: hypothetical protein AAFR82_01235 [Pseudomonadota bacterium]
MSDATFETFLVSGLLVLIAAVAYLAWSAWRWVDRERDMEKRAMVGVSYELRHNLKRMMSELAGLANGSLKSEIEIVPVVHPQLDALLSRPNEADRGGLTVIRGNYNELSAHKQSLRAALAGQTDINVPANIAADAVIGSLATLYLWEEHKGCAADAARSTRSWDVRDWMKVNKFHADSLPGLHLRDQVVERLRGDGMTLTPKPLTYTASEYFAKQYDRKADPNAPFWKRKKKKPVEEAAAVAAAGLAAAAIVEPDEVVVPESVLESTPAPALESTPEAAPEVAPVDEPVVVEAVDTSVEPESAETVEMMEEADSVDMAMEPDPVASPEPEADSEETPVVETAAETVGETEAEAAAETVVETAAEEPSMPDAEPDPVDPSVEPTPEPKPPTPGVIH